MNLLRQIQCLLQSQGSLLISQGSPHILQGRYQIGQGNHPPLLPRFRSHLLSRFHRLQPLPTPTLILLSVAIPLELVALEIFCNPPSMLSNMTHISGINFSYSAVTTLLFSPQHLRLLAPLSLLPNF